MRATCPPTQRGTRARTAAAREPRRRQQTPSGRSGTPTTLTDLIRHVRELRKRVHHSLLQALVCRRRRGSTA